MASTIEGGFGFDVEGQKRRMAEAVGHCMLAFANVEITLTLIFRWAVGGPAPVCDSILSEARSFELRSTIIHNAVKYRLHSRGQPVDDWNLLYNHLVRLSGRRNQVAHATLLIDVDLKEVLLEPFFVLSQQKPRLSLSDVEGRAPEFVEMNDALMWFSAEVDALHPAQISFPVSKLLVRLRVEEQQRRDEQRRLAALKP